MINFSVTYKNAKQSALYSGSEVGRILYLDSNISTIISSNNDT